ncbi:LasR-specific antiactivator QslA [Stutzerimonas nitrititolerans]|uniref:LasR-specific antiactivator QslA n=1 Tax=Stutzerimonas nitrititolerans TaxID=2482751 RepID=UPI0035E3F039
MRLDQQSQASFTHGVQQAQARLDDANSGWLWANLNASCSPPDAQRHTFELRFLSCVNQRLCSPLGGGHQARRTALQLQTYQRGSPRAVLLIQTVKEPAQAVIWIIYVLALDPLSSAAQFSKEARTTMHRSSFLSHFKLPGVLITAS